MEMPEDILSQVKSIALFSSRVEARFGHKTFLEIRTLTFSSKAASPVTGAD